MCCKLFIIFVIIITPTMKTTQRLLALASLVLLLNSCVTMAILSKKQAAPKNYQTKVQTEGIIEKKYMANGPYAVSCHEDGALQVFEKYLTFYPSELETKAGKWPVIVLCNGSGTPLSKYTTVAKHYASWGFLVIGTEEKFSWNAFGAEMSLRYLEIMNGNEKVGDKASVFYQKVDFEHVGIVGHSQGGVGVISAVTNTDHKDVYKTAVALSPTNIELAKGIMWDYDASKIQVPIMLVSGEGGGDDWVVTGEQLKAIYDEIPGSRLMVRRKDTPHGETLYSANGYVCAWFMWQLKGDIEASSAFIGASPEIINNSLYQDQRSAVR